MTLSTSDSQHKDTQNKQNSVSSAIMLSGYTECHVPFIVILSVVKLNFFILSFFILSVVILSVNMPCCSTECHYDECRYAKCRGAVKLVTHLAFK